MAMRRRGRPGDYLMTDDWTGCTDYASRMKKDYWGNLSAITLKRNLQEISSPLNDPYPVPEYRGPQYEQIGPCGFELIPQFIGNTSVPFPTSFITNALGSNPSIPFMKIGCTFIVSPDFSQGDVLGSADGDTITTPDGDFIGVL